MRLLQQTLYQKNLDSVISCKLPWETLKNSSVMISGATGMIGSFLIDVLMRINQKNSLNIHIFALGRTEDKAKSRFEEYWNDPHFTFAKYDVDLPIDGIFEKKVDYIFHFASSTHPLAYSQDPIGTILPNIIGTNNLLDFASSHHAKRVVFASSVEIYGENRGDVDKFKEDYLGYIDCNTLRAGYPESKRAGESLCQAYIKQKGLDVVIPRLSRVYGPTMLFSDSKALSQFIKKALKKEDIVLKSEGKQFYSYSYVADAVSAILFILFKGQNGQAYNISDSKSDITLKDLAHMIATSVGKNVVFELPDEKEKAGYSKATKAVLDSTKLQSLGWKAEYSISDGLRNTIAILEDLIS